MNIWGSLLWLFSFLAVYGLGCLGAMLLVHAEQRWRDQEEQEQRVARATERRTALSASAWRSDPVGPGACADPQLRPLAPPSTPADVVERQAATPAGFNRGG